MKTFPNDKLFKKEGYRKRREERMSGRKEDRRPGRKESEKS